MLILEFVREREASANISEARAKKIIFRLVGWRRFLAVPYRVATIGDIYGAVSKLKNGTSGKGKPIKQITIHDAIRILKPFLLWMVESEYSTLPEKKVKAIKSPSVDHVTTDPNDLLSVEGVEALLRAEKTTRDRAFVDVLYESATRIAELCCLRWKDVEFDRFGAKVYIDDTKTKKRRYVRLTMAAQYLSA